LMTKVCAARNRIGYSELTKVNSYPVPPHP
jgi:hypothetical protein